MRAVPTFADSGTFQTTSGIDLALSDIYVADGGGNPHFTLHVNNSGSAQQSFHVRSKNSTASYFEFTSEVI